MDKTFQNKSEDLIFLQRGPTSMYCNDIYSIKEAENLFYNEINLDFHSFLEVIVYIKLYL